jgi:hypothetical protein
MGALLTYGAATLGEMFVFLIAGILLCVIWTLIREDEAKLEEMKRNLDKEPEYTGRQCKKCEHIWVNKQDNCPVCWSVEWV